MLVICGLGCDPQRETTLEALAALSGCVSRFSDAKPATRAWLARRTGPVKAARDAATVVAAAREGLCGLAVWGHPTVTSTFAREVLAAAAKAGVEVVVLPGITPISHAMSAGARALGWRRDEDSGWTAAPVNEASGAFPVASFDSAAEEVRVRG